MMEYMWIGFLGVGVVVCLVACMAINPKKTVSAIKKCFKKILGKSDGGNEVNKVNQQTVGEGNVNVIATEGGVVNVDMISNEDRAKNNESSKNDTRLHIRENREIDSSEIALAHYYTSLFAEDNRLKTEQIIIESQEHGSVEGKVLLTEKESGHEVRKLTYNLIGRFYNKVLTAEYVSVDNRMDERGTINLKLIDSNLLSGFCSFSRLSPTDDEIRVSPYVWVAGSNRDLLNGTYDFCTQCSAEKTVCCCASEEIDMPLFLDEEVDKISALLSSGKRAKRNYSTILPQPFDGTGVRQIKREDADGEGTISKCFFFNQDTKKCRIYEGRPLDCRLFPFDIKLSKDKSEYIVGYYTELCDRMLPDYSAMRRHAHILRPYFFLLYPYLHIYTSEIICPRLENAEFKKIDTFKSFVF